jgi:tetrahydromethanopterin S-methyltransferase subunit C
LSPLIAVVIVNCLSAAALFGGAVALRRATNSRTGVVVSGVLIGVSIEIVAATVALFFPANSWPWAVIKILGRLLELTLGVRFLLYLSEKSKNGSVKV